MAYGRKRGGRSWKGKRRGGNRQGPWGRRSEDGELPPPKPATRDTIMERAFRLLAARDRGIEELRRRLMERDDATEAVVNEVIASLLDYRYLDDERFAREFSRSKILTRPMGRRRLERELLNKHLDEDLVTRTMDELYEEKYPEEQLVAELIERHVKSKGLPDCYDTVRKLSAKLMRRGFGPGLVRDHTSALWQRAKEEGADRAAKDKEKTVTEEEQYEQMDALIAKFIRIKGKPKNFKEARKLTERLMRRGFSFDMIRERVDPLWKS